MGHIKRDEPVKDRPQRIDAIVNVIERDSTIMCKRLQGTSSNMEGFACLARCVAGAKRNAIEPMHHAIELRMVGGEIHHGFGKSYGPGLRIGSGFRRDEHATTYFAEAEQQQLLEQSILAGEMLVNDWRRVLNKISDFSDRQISPCILT